MKTGGTPTRTVFVRPRPLRHVVTEERAPRAADLALLRACLGLPADAPLTVYATTDRGARR